MYTTVNTRGQKRRHLPEVLPDTGRPPAKRQRLEARQRSSTPPEFWDNLSRQWLTPRALREFNRRAAAVALPTRLLQPDPAARHLSCQQLKRFARQGGPDLRDIRGYHERCSLSQGAERMSRSRKRSERLDSSSTSSKTKRSKRSSAYDLGFEQHLVDYGVYPDGDEDMEPLNMDAITDRLGESRPSLSPSHFTRAEFTRFKQANRDASREGSVISKVLPLLMGNDEDIYSEQDVLFNNLRPITDGSIVKAKPDKYDGARASEINKDVRAELDNFIMPSTDRNVPVLPNFFVEAKGPSGSGAVGKRQACYDGALGARAMHEMQAYATGDRVLDNKAYTITSTFQGGSGGGSLTLYSIHPTASTAPDRTTDYRLTQLDGWHMTGNMETFRKGVGAIRNARDWAKEQRETLIVAANEKDAIVASATPETSTHTGLSQSTAAADLGTRSDTSVDDLAIASGNSPSDDCRFDFKPN